MANKIAEHPACCRKCPTTQTLVQHSRVCKADPNNWIVLDPQNTEFLAVMNMAESNAFNSIFGLCTVFVSNS